MSVPGTCAARPKSSSQGSADVLPPHRSHCRESTQENKSLFKHSRRSLVNARDSIALVRILVHVPSFEPEEQHPMPTYVCWLSLLRYLLAKDCRSPCPRRCSCSAASDTIRECSWPYPTLRPSDARQAPAWRERPPPSPCSSSCQTDTSQRQHTHTETKGQMGLAVASSCENVVPHAQQ